MIELAKGEQLIKNWNYESDNYKDSNGASTSLIVTNKRIVKVTESELLYEHYEVPVDKIDRVDTLCKTDKDRRKLGMILSIIGGVLALIGIIILAASGSPVGYVFLSPGILLVVIGMVYLTYKKGVTFSVFFSSLSCEKEVELLSLGATIFDRKNKRNNNFTMTVNITAAVEMARVLPRIIVEIKSGKYDVEPDIVEIPADLM